MDLVQVLLSSARIISAICIVLSRLIVFLLQTVLLFKVLLVIIRDIGGLFINLKHSLPSSS